MHSSLGHREITHLLLMYSSLGHREETFLLMHSSLGQKLKTARPFSVRAKKTEWTKQANQLKRRIHDLIGFFPV